jgi:hypothetical protein
MTTSARPTRCFLRADVVIGPYAVEKITAREIGIWGSRFFAFFLHFSADIFALQAHHKSKNKTG